MNPKNRPHAAEVIEKIEVTDTLVVLKLKPQSALSFQPGQYCTLGIEGTERAYSIASAPHQPFLEFFIEVVPGGTLTPKFRRLRSGSTLTLRPRVQGRFTLEEDRTDQVMVATVTGVAPFISMIRHVFHRGPDDRRFFLLHGASYRDEFHYRGEMETLAAEHPGAFHYLPSVSRPAEDRNRGWPGAGRRINELVEPTIERFRLRPASTRVYACGNPAMIEDVRERLIPRGFPVKQEKYWEE